MYFFHKWVLDIIKRNVIDFFAAVLQLANLKKNADQISYWRSLLV